MLSGADDAGLLCGPLAHRAGDISLCGHGIVSMQWAGESCGWGPASPHWHHCDRCCSLQEGEGPGSVAVLGRAVTPQPQPQPHSWAVPCPPRATSGHSSAALLQARLTGPWLPERGRAWETQQCERVRDSEKLYKIFAEIQRDAISWLPLAK